MNPKPRPDTPSPPAEPTLPVILKPPPGLALEIPTAPEPTEVPLMGAFGGSKAPTAGPLLPQAALFPSDVAAASAAQVASPEPELLWMPDLGMFPQCRKGSCAQSRLTSIAGLPQAQTW